MATLVYTTHETWKLFDFIQFQKDLDSSATDIASRQDSSDVSKKKLIELSKEFKQIASEDVKKLVGPLLKSFQSEVDSLTKRSKKAEAEYLSLYRKLIDLPDPTPALEKCIAQQQKLQKISDYEIENKQLRETLEDFKAEFALVKNQEVTVKTLRDRVRELEDSMEISITTRLREKERELSLQFAEREKQLNEQRLDAARRVGEMEHKMRSLQQALDHSQSELFDMKSKHEEILNSRNAELELFNMEAERTTERCCQLQEEVNSLRDQLEKATNGDGLGSTSVRNKIQVMEAQCQQSEQRIWELETELSTKEKEVMQLVDEGRRNQHALQHLRDANATHQMHLEAELDSLRKQCTKLRQELCDQSDYEELRREVQILRSVEFGEFPISDESLQSHSSGATIESDNANLSVSTKPLEQLLVEKNRSLQHELTLAKVDNEKLNKLLLTRQDELVDSQNAVAKQTSLIKNLEEDLRQVRSFSSQLRGSGEGQDSVSVISGDGYSDTYRNVTQSMPSVSEERVLSQLVPTLELENTSHGDNVDGAGAVSSPLTSGNNSLLDIVQSQRERFRVRTQELESHNISLQQQIHFLQSEMDKLRADNIKLYEKVKFLQSYSDRSVHDEESRSVLDRYSGEYEERMNPFTSFSKRERQRKYENLRAHDKIVLSMGRLIFNNPVARMVAVLYAIVLHLLVFLVLYKLAHTETCRRDIADECTRRFAEHMKSHKD